MRLFHSLLLALVIAMPALASAETIAIPPGSFEAPAGLETLDRTEEVDPVTGKPNGILVFTKAGDLPRAIFIVSYTVAAADAPAFDARDAAVKIGNPFDPALTAKEAEPVAIGGVAGATYRGTLANGLVVKSYAVEKNGYRIVVLLKAPPKKQYETLMDAFAKSFQAFSWKTGDKPKPASN